MGLHTIPVLAEGAIDRLLQYDWPGNVRELANVVERALIQSDGKILVFDDAMPALERAPVPTAATAAEPSGPDAGTPADATVRYFKLEEVEARHIRSVMEATGGRIEGKKGAAVLLGMNPATLRYRMQKLGIPFGRSKTGNLARGG
jgi:DNA-binding NtrC family response regulator